MIEGDKLKGLKRIGLKLATYVRRRGTEQNSPKVSYMTSKEIN